MKYWLRGARIGPRTRVWNYTQIRDEASVGDESIIGRNVYVDEAVVIGNRVKGGMYSEYPSLRPADLQQGDLAPNYDFRGFYSTVVEKWLGLDPVSIVGGNFEQLDFI